MAVSFGDLHEDVRTHADKPSRTKKRAMGSQGRTFVTDTGFVFNEETITADNLYNYRTKNIYGRGVQRKQRALLFREMQTVKMLNPDGDADETQTKFLHKMCVRPNVNLWLRIQQTFDSVFWYGASLFNPVMDWVGNSYEIQAINRLPAITFKKPATFSANSVMTASNGGNTRVQGHFLKGISLLTDESGNENLEFHQTNYQGMSLKQLDSANVLYITEPDCELVGGDPMVYPLCPIFEMLKYGWSTRMQQVNRCAIPLTYAEVPAGASEDDVRDVKKILRNMGKETTFIVPEGVKITTVDIRDGATVDEAIGALNRMIIDYISPSTFLDTRSGAVLGGSVQPQQEMMNQYIAGQLQWLENVWENFLYEHYLLPNGFDDDWSIEITIPAPSTDKSAQNANKANIGANTRIAHPNEIRKLLDLDEKDDEGLTEIKQAWELVDKAQAPATPSFPGAGMNPALGSPFPQTQTMTNTGGASATDERLASLIDSLATDVNKRLKSIER